MNLCVNTKSVSKVSHLQLLFRASYLYHQHVRGILLSSFHLNGEHAPTEFSIPQVVLKSVFAHYYIIIINCTILS